MTHLQHLVGKLFPGADSVAFDDGHRQLVALNSRLGESMHLVPTVHLELDEARQQRLRGTHSTHDDDARRNAHGRYALGGPSEADAAETPLGWLKQLEQVMWGSVHRQIDRARVTYEFDGFEKWMLNHTQQALAVARSILFTVKVEEVLSEFRNKRELLGHGHMMSIRMTEIIARTLGSQGSQLSRHKCVAAALEELKQRDVLDKLTRADPRNAEDYEWQRQLRHGWDLQESSIEGRVVVRVLHNTYPYALEYLGNPMPLMWSMSLGNDICMQKVQP